MASRLKRNGTIEFMRFVFCAIVILYHTNNRLLFEEGEVFSFFKNGRIGVEFFFIVSGWLMAKSAKKYSKEHILSSTGRFISGKLKSVIVYHIFIYLVCLAITVFMTADRTPDARADIVISTLPNLFFLQKTGIKAVELLTPEWYIAAMLWMMLLIFPLILRFGDRFTKLACPLITVLLIGYMSHINGKLGGTDRFIFNDALPKAYIRAFAEMCGGAFCFEVSGFFGRLKFTKADRIILTVTELIGYVLPILYTVSLWSEKYEAFCFYSLCVSVTLSFSEVTYLGKVFDNKLSVFLGKTSLPLYMAQAVGFNVFLFSKSLMMMSRERVLAFFIVSTVIFAVISYIINYAVFAFAAKRRKEKT